MSLIGLKIAEIASRNGMTYYDPSCFCLSCCYFRGGGKMSKYLDVGADPSGSNDGSKLNSTSPNLFRPGAKKHLVGSAVKVEPTQIGNCVLEFQDLIQSHIKYHIDKNRLPHCIEFWVDAKPTRIELSLSDIITKENINYLIAEALIGKIVTDADGHFAYCIYIWTVPSPLRTG